MSIFKKPQNLAGPLPLATADRETTAIEKKIGFIGRLQTDLAASRAAAKALQNIEEARIQGQAEVVQLATQTGIQQLKLGIANAVVDSTGALLVGLNGAMAAADQALGNSAHAETISHLINRQENFVTAEKLRASGIVDDEELAELMMLARADCAESLGRSRTRAEKSVAALERMYDAALSAYDKART